MGEEEAKATTYFIREGNRAVFLLSVREDVLEEMIEKRHMRETWFSGLHIYFERNDAEKLLKSIKDDKCHKEPDA